MPDIYELYLIRHGLAEERGDAWPDDNKRPLTEAQFAGLKTVFTQGVCDFSRKGAGQSAPDTWLSYPRPGESAGLARTQD